MGISVGAAIEVFWPQDKEYYSARIAAYDSKKGTYCVKYDDGEVEDLNLAREQWRFVPKQLDSEKPKPGNIVIKHNVAPFPQTPTSVTAQAGTFQPTSRASALSSGRRSTRASKPKLAQNPPSGAVKKKRTVLPKRKSPKRSSSPESPREYSLSSGQASTQSVVSRKSSPTTLSRTVRKSHLLIERCADSWLQNELRRKQQPSMFSAYRCLSHVIDMMLVAWTNPSYERKLLGNMKLDSKSWVISGNVDEDRRKLYSRWGNGMTQSEWTSEKLMLSSISKHIGEAEASFTERNYENDLLEATALVMFARGCVKKHK